MSASSQSLRFILSLRLYSSFITSTPDLKQIWSKFLSSQNRRIMIQESIVSKIRVTMVTHQLHPLPASSHLVLLLSPTKNMTTHESLVFITVGLRHFCESHLWIPRGWESGRPNAHHGEITRGYRFSYDYWYRPPSRSNWIQGVQLLLEGGPYVDVLRAGKNIKIDSCFLTLVSGERNGSVVECLTRDRGPRVQASPASLRCGP